MKARLRLLAGGGLLALLIVGAVFADFLAPYEPAEQHREYPFAPPSRWQFKDAQGRWRWPPRVTVSKLLDQTTRQYSEAASAVYPLKFWRRGAAYRWLGLLPSTTHLFTVEEPARVFVLGTDGLGRDVWTRVLHGARFSLLLAAAALLLALPLALIVGLVAGFYGGWLDFGLMRLAELFLALPALYLVIALRSALPLNLEPEQVFGALVLVIGFFGWAQLARLTRGLVLALRQQEYVTAALALGASDGWIMRRHLLPQLAGFTLTQAALAAPGYILAEVTLSYLGLGLPEPLPSWGNMLGGAQNVQTLTNYWWNLAPAVAVFITSLAFYLLAEGLKDVFDPRAQTSAVDSRGW
ncbi:MAG: ABC transporter permease [Acidobacteria bacterium]|nr:ABC transporter permease [Acidobacteriota bacterium]MBI3422378.1 ABC transporter permease [Acidobacteriota bacterium]